MLYSTFIIPLSVVNQLISLLPQITAKSCLSIRNESRFYIRDTEAGRCICHVSTDEVIHVTVENVSGSLVNFLAVDGCLFSSGDGERCDCLLFNEKIICFIEIKVVGFNGGPAARKKAKNQLQSSINYFKDIIDLSTIELRAYACVGKIEARPSVSATDINERVRFANMNVELFHGNTVDL